MDPGAHRPVAPEPPGSVSGVAPRRGADRRVLRLADRPARAAARRGLPGHRDPGLRRDHPHSDNQPHPPDQRVVGAQGHPRPHHALDELRVPRRRSVLHGLHDAQQLRQHPEGGARRRNSGPDDGRRHLQDAGPRLHPGLLRRRDRRRPDGEPRHHHRPAHVHDHADLQPADDRRRGRPGLHHRLPDRLRPRDDDAGVAAVRREPHHPGLAAHPGHTGDADGPLLRAPDRRHHLPARGDHGDARVLVELAPPGPETAPRTDRQPNAPAPCWR